MAQIYGNQGNNFGEKAIYKELATLPEGWIVYSQPIIVGESDEREPDFVIIHPEIGLIVLEVKDWLAVGDINKTEAEIPQKNDDKPNWQTSPVRQAKKACYHISNELQKFPELLDEKGRLMVAWRHAGVLPRLPQSEINRLRKVWGFYRVFGILDFTNKTVESTLRSIPPKWNNKLNGKQIDIIRGVIDSSLKIGNNGILDQTQEEYAKSDFTKVIQRPEKYEVSQPSVLQLKSNDSEKKIPKEITETSKNQSVRLIRGAAGTGKTDVILLRCKYLSQHFSETRNLVTTFNIPVAESRFESVLSDLEPTITFRRFGQICQDIYYKRYSVYNNPQDSEGVIKAIFEKEPKFEKMKEEYDVDFLVHEFQWMKENDLVTHESYLSAIREGRGGVKGRTLSKSQKEVVFDFFETYQKVLGELPALDWTDFYHRALSILKNNDIEYKKYDEILIDEAQHFAPKWIELLRLLLSENGRLFLCEDPTQSVYRAYSWLQKGVEVRGRTKWLKIPYRSTRQILKAAYSLISDNQNVQNLLKETDNFEWPDLNAEALRDGNLPELHIHIRFVEQQEFIRNKIEELIKWGYDGSDIAILHTQKYARDPFEDLKKKGVIVDEINRNTGMEWKIVFIPKLNDFLYKYEEEMGGDENLSSLYTAMTRSKDMVFMFNEKEKVPKVINQIKNHLQIITHT